jgi:hypothetical protein
MSSRWIALSTLLLVSRLTLGVEYSRDIGPVAPGSNQISVDAQASVYYVNSYTSVVKRTSTGNVAWGVSLGSIFFIGAITVDLSGNVYALPRVLNHRTRYS